MPRPGQQLHLLDKLVLYALNELTKNSNGEWFSVNRISQKVGSLVGLGYVADLLPVDTEQTLVTACLQKFAELNTVVAAKLVLNNIQVYKLCTATAAVRRLCELLQTEYQFNNGFRPNYTTSDVMEAYAMLYIGEVGRVLLQRQLVNEEQHALERLSTDDKLILYALDQLDGSSGSNWHGAFDIRAYICRAIYRNNIVSNHDLHALSVSVVHQRLDRLTDKGIVCTRFESGQGQACFVYKLNCGPQSNISQLVSVLVLTLRTEAAMLGQLDLAHLGSPFTRDTQQAYQTVCRAVYAANTEEMLSTEGKLILCALDQLRNLLQSSEQWQHADSVQFKVATLIDAGVADVNVDFLTVDVVAQTLNRFASCGLDIVSRSSSFYKLNNQPIALALILALRDELCETGRLDSSSVGSFYTQQMYRRIVYQTLPRVAAADEPLPNNNLEAVYQQRVRQVLESKNL